jgi:hypothetical protein
MDTLRHCDIAVNIPNIQTEKQNLFVLLRLCFFFFSESMTMKDLLKKN